MTPPEADDLDSKPTPPPVDWHRLTPEALLDLLADQADWVGPLIEETSNCHETRKFIHIERPDPVAPDPESPPQSAESSASINPVRFHERAWP
jgi:hypothetical protein